MSFEEERHREEPEAPWPSKRDLLRLIVEAGALLWVLDDDTVTPLARELVHEGCLVEEPRIGGVLWRPTMAGRCLA